MHLPGPWLGFPVVPFYTFLRGDSPTDCRKKGTLFLTSLLEDLDGEQLDQLP